MMTKKKQFGWVLIMALMTACSSTHKQAMQKEVSTIDLTEIEFSSTPQPLSDFVESIEYIKLSEEPLVTDVVFTRLSEDKNGNLYLDVPGGLFKYAPDGTFIKNLIKIGQGPNEIIHKVDAIFNIEQEFIQIYDNGKSYYQKISLDGDFLERTDRSIISNGEYLGRRDIYAYWGL